MTLRQPYLQDLSVLKTQMKELVGNGQPGELATVGTTHQYP